MECFVCCLRGHPFMTSAKFWDFLTPSPPCPRWETGLYHKIHATSLTLSAFPLPPSPPQRGRHKWMSPNAIFSCGADRNALEFGLALLPPSLPTLFLCQRNWTGGLPPVRRGATAATGRGRRPPSRSGRGCRISQTARGGKAPLIFWKSKNGIPFPGIAAF